MRTDFYDVVCKHDSRAGKEENHHHICTVPEFEPEVQEEKGKSEQNGNQCGK